MSRSAALVASATAFLLTACASVVRPLDTALAVKTGLWDVSSGINDKETIQIPQEFIDRMSAADRESYYRLEQESAKFPKMRSKQICVTAEDLRAGVFNALTRMADDGCELKVKSASATHQEVELTCPSNGGGTRTRYISFDVQTTEAVRGKLVSRQEVTRNVIDIEGKWLAATCGSPTRR